MKEFVVPRGLMFKNFIDCMFNNNIATKIQNNCYNAYIWQINKIIRD